MIRYVTPSHSSDRVLARQNYVSTCMIRCLIIFPISVCDFFPISKPPVHAYPPRLSFCITTAELPR